MNALPLGARHVGADAPPPPEEGGRKLTRRQLFVRGAFAAGGLMIGGAVLRFGLLLKEAPKAGLLVFSEKEVEILEAVLGAFFPGAEGMPPADLDYMVPRIDAFLAQNDPDSRLLFKTLLHVIEEQALLFRFSRFTRCSPPVQAEEIRAWELTPIYVKKAAFKSFKVVIASYYAEQPDAREAMGWYLGCQPAHLAPSRVGGAGV